MNLKKTTLQLLFLFCGIISVQSQNQGPITVRQQQEGGHLNTIKAKYDIEFNLPQFDISLVIPANTTFKLPRIIDDDVALEIDKVSYYSFDLKYLDQFSTRIIKFFESYKDKDPVLILEIEPYNEDVSLFVQNNPKKNVRKYYENLQTDKEKASLPIKSELGISLNRILKDDELSYSEYSFFKDGYAFNFYLDMDFSEETRARYLEIIGSISEKNLFQKRVQYKNRAKYNFYKLEKHPKLPADKEYKFDHYKGKTTRDNIAINTLQQTEIRIPVETEYMITANHVEEVGCDSLLIYVNLNDYINNGQSQETYFMEGFNLFISSLRNVEDIDGYVSQLSDDYQVSKSAVAMVGEDPLYIYYYGAKDQGTLDLYLRTNGLSLLNLRVYGYSKKTKDKILGILGTFRFMGIPLPYLEDAVSLEEGDEVEFVTIILPDPDIQNASKIEMMDVGVKGMLPGQIADYMVSRMQKVAKMSPTGILMKAKPTDRMGMSLYREQSPVLLYLGLSDKPADMDDALKDLVRSWGSNNQISDIEAAGLILNNVRWNVMIYKLGDVYYATAITFAEGCLIALYVNDVKSRQDIMDNLAYIKTFELGKPLKK